MEESVIPRPVPIPKECSGEVAWKRDERRLTKDGKRKKALTKRGVEGTKYEKHFRSERKAKRIRWSVAESEALVKGVARHGAGNWSLIKADKEFSNLFSLRTSLDLKDKWRNLRSSSKSTRQTRSMSTLPSSSSSSLSSSLPSQPQQTQNNSKQNQEPE